VLDGFVLCREWKKDRQLRDIPFVIYPEPKDRKLVLDPGGPFPGQPPGAATGGRQSLYRSEALTAFLRGRTALT